MDLDGDGYLSMYELEYFYEEQLQRMEQLGIETLPFEDCLCQVGCPNGKKLECRFTPLLEDPVKLNESRLPDVGHDHTRGSQPNIHARPEGVPHDPHLL